MNKNLPVAPQRKSYIGIILLAAFILSIIGIIINFIMTVKTLERESASRIGDGVHVDSYQFDLSNLTIEMEYIVPSGLHKAGLEVIDYPEFITPEDVDMIKKEVRGKYQVSGDKIVGLNINGDVRAYPIRVLQWHEVINDVVGGVPVAVTYSPLSDSVVVFDRRVNGETLEFGVSGLLYNSTLLLYDRRPDSSQESLWSQLQFRAVSGPAADADLSLRILPCVQTRWDDWKNQYPNTKIVKPNIKKIRQYQGDPYGPYHSMDNLNYSVSPEPPLDIYQNKTKILILSIQNQYYPIPYPVIQKGLDESNHATVDVNGLSFSIHYTPMPELCQLDLNEIPDGVQVGTAYSYHFAWYAHHPGISYFGQ